MAPEFHHFDNSALPKWNDGSASFTLVAGEGYGKKSPVPVHSHLFMIEVKNEEEYTLNTSGELQGEIGICVVTGNIEACGKKIEKGNILVSKVEDTCEITLSPKTHILLFGGLPFPEERNIYWNFVLHDKEKIEKAKTDWAAKTFPMMKNDKSYVPLPGS